MLPLGKRIEIDDLCILGVKNCWHITKVPIPCSATRASIAAIQDVEDKEKTEELAFMRYHQKVEVSEPVELQHNKTHWTEDVNYTSWATRESRDMSENEQKKTAAAAFMRYHRIERSKPLQLQQNKTHWTADSNYTTTNEAQCSTPPPVIYATISQYIDEAQRMLLPTLICSMPPPVKDAILSRFIEETHIKLLPVLGSAHCSVPPPTIYAMLFRYIQEATLNNLFPKFVFEQCTVPPPATDAMLSRYIQEATYNNLFPILVSCSAPSPATDGTLSRYIEETMNNKLFPIVVSRVEMLSLQQLSNRKDSLRRKLAEVNKTRTSRSMRSVPPASKNEVLSEDIIKSSDKSVPSIILPAPQEANAIISLKPGTQNAKERALGLQVGRHFLSRMCGISEQGLNETTVTGLSALFLLVIFFYAIRKIRTRNQEQQVKQLLQKQQRARYDASRQTQQGASHCKTTNSGYHQALIDAAIVRSALAHCDTKENVKTREPDLHKRVVKEWSPMLPILVGGTRQKHGCHLLIRKLTRLSSISTCTDRLLGFIEEWMISVLQTATREKKPSKYRSMIEDLYLFLQVKYELPANAVITLLPFVMANASVEDICCERRLGKIIFSAEAKLGDFFEGNTNTSVKSKPASTISTKTKPPAPKPELKPKAESTDSNGKTRLPSKASLNDSFATASNGKKIQNTVPPSSEKNKDPQQKSAILLDETDNTTLAGCPLVLDVNDVTNSRDTTLTKEVANSPRESDRDISEHSTANSLSMIKIPEQGLSSHGKNEHKIPVHGSSRRRSPRSKDSFVYRVRYLEAARKLKMEKRKSNSVE